MILSSISNNCSVAINILANNANLFWEKQNKKQKTKEKKKKEKKIFDK